ncbi:hypothetical protein SKAU_G00104690 [Synaphobranchus kaupii]|uniref:Uncharacterized protein n=1 Tax=Synaphobranchus kaupii TaxID=118154 RepID=A0A9Q1J7S1_SYNKA|nr:hypothetical protein SKAU_G00104690 [Synaphobranchus kaupii]
MCIEQERRISDEKKQAGHKHRNDDAAPKCLSRGRWISPPPLSRSLESHHTGCSTKSRSGERGGATAKGPAPVPKRPFSEGADRRTRVLQNDQLLLFLAAVQQTSWRGVKRRRTGADEAADTGRFMPSVSGLLPEPSYPGLWAIGSDPHDSWPCSRFDEATGHFTAQCTAPFPAAAGSSSQAEPK